VIRKMAYFPIMVLQVTSLVIFLLFGAEIAFALGLSWMIAGLLFGVAFAETGRVFRRWAVAAALAVRQ